MQEIRCKKCGSNNHVKSVYVRDNQRYKCKDCGCNFKIGDWEGYRQVIPQKKLTQCKKYTIGIEQNNSNARHYLGRMTRKTKVVSKSIEMLNISLLITCYLNEYNGYEVFQNIFLSIFM